MSYEYWYCPRPGVASRVGKIHPFLPSWVLQDDLVPISSSFLTFLSTLVPTVREFWRAEVIRDSTLPGSSFLSRAASWLWYALFTMSRLYLACILRNGETVRNLTLIIIRTYSNLTSTPVELIHCFEVIIHRAFFVIYSNFVYLSVA